MSNVLQNAGKQRKGLLIRLASIEAMWTLFALITYFGGMQQNGKFEEVVEFLWSWNIAQALGAPRLPYDFGDISWISFAFYIFFPGIVIFMMFMLIAILIKGSVK